MADIRYEIDDKGKLNIITDTASTRGFATVNDALEDRINRLEQMLDSDCALELDLAENDNTVWNAMRYYNNMKRAEPLYDKDGHPVTAFDGIDYVTVRDFLYENDIYYVG